MVRKAAKWSGKLPVYNTLHHLLTNPIYAGAYAFGRTGSRITIEAGRKRIVRGFRRERGAWEVLIRDHLEGYIGWAEFERNQRLITDNANGKSFMSRGSIRRGEALLAGLLRRGHCGRKLHVAYSGENGSAGRYHCRGGHLNHGSDPCISFGGLRIDRAIGAEVIERVQPLGIEAAIGAMEARRAENAEQRRQVELAIEQARYEAVRARRQYDAVDPDNRLVAAELEQRWNARLLAVHALEDQREALAASLYRALDLLGGAQAKIEAKLAPRHLTDGCLVLYDLTSSWLEGRCCELARFGYSRDGQRAKLQIVFGLLCNAEGCPIAIEVFECDTADPATLAAQVAKLKQRFELGRVVLVGDRGMITGARIEQDLKPAGLEWITALRAPAIQALAAEGGPLQLSLFDQRDLAEITSPDYPGERLVVCRARAAGSARVSSQPDCSYRVLALAAAARPTALPPEVAGDLRSKPRHPHSDGFVAHGDPALGQEVLDITQAQGEARIQPHRMLNDRLGKAETAVGCSRHPGRLTAPRRSCKPNLTTPL